MKWPLRFLASALAGLLFLACVLVGTPAYAAVSVGVTLAVSRDGIGQYTSSDGPGLDTGPNNGVVRTNDFIEYTVAFNAVGGTAPNTTFTLEAPDGTEWTQLPPQCVGAGSGISNGILTCNVGDLTNTTMSVPVLLRVNSKNNGEVISMTTQAKADGVTSVSAGPVNTTVSAAARFDLSKNDFPGGHFEAIGPDGATQGGVFTFPLTIQGLPQDPTHPEYPPALGAQSLSSPLTISDSLSQLLGGNPSAGAVLYTVGGQGCGVNGIPGAAQTLGPLGAGGGTQAVTDSGSWQCVQNGPGQDISLTITGADTSMKHVPTAGSGGSPLPANSAYAVSGWIQIWIPQAEIDAATGPSGLVNIRNCYATLSSVSDPSGNNCQDISINTSPFGSYAKVYDAALTNDPAGNATLHGAGNGIVTPLEKFRSRAAAANYSVRGFVSIDIVCDKFDNATQTLTTINGVYTTAAAPATVEYAAASWSSPTEQRDATCDDAEGPWFADPNAVPGGIEAVGKVRWKLANPVGPRSYLAFHTHLQAKEGLPDGTRLRNFAAYKEANRPWNVGTADPEESTGGFADRLIVTGVKVRVAKKVVDPATTPATTPDQTRQVNNGDSVLFALYPSLTTFAGNPAPADVTVMDTLPAGLSYAGQASITPASVVSNSDGTTTITWLLPAQTPNVTIPPVTFRVTGASLVAGTVTNTVEVATPHDVSPAPQRQATRPLAVLTPAGLAVTKTAKASPVIVGDSLEYALAYSNTTATPLSQVDIIDVLPYNGDGRTPPSSFHGTVNLATALTVGPGEEARYTSAAAGAIDLDPGAASNQLAGATKWCLSAEFGSAGCPSNLASVTGFRVLRTAPLGPNEAWSRDIALSAVGAHDADVYTNRFGARAPQLPLPVYSNDATVTVVAGCIGDYVWIDANNDGIQDVSESPRGGVAIRLVGTDDKGGPVDRATTSDSDGKYLFPGLRPGTYTVQFANPDGARYGWTTHSVGSDKAIDSDVDTSGKSGSVVLSAATDSTGATLSVDCDLTVDAGLILIPLDPPKPPDPPTPPTPPTGEKHLPVSGGNTGPVIAAALLTLLAGLVLVAVARRRS